MVGRGKIKLENSRVNLFPSAVNWEGNIRMYFRGHSEGSNHIIEVVLNDHLALLGESAIKDIPTPLISFYPYPVVQPSGDDGNEKLHLFSERIDRSNGNYRVIYDVEKKEYIGGKKNPLRMTRNSFYSVASCNDGVIIVVLDKDTQEIHLYLVNWDNLYTFNNVVKKTIKVPDEKLKFLNVLSSCVTVMPNDDVRDMETHLLLGLSYLSKDESGLYFGEIKVSFDRDEAQSDSQCLWEKHPNRQRLQNKVLVSMFLSPSGAVYAKSMDVSRPSADADIDSLDELLAVPTKAIDLWRRENINKWVSLGNPCDEDLGEIYFPGCVGYIMGEVQETISAQNNELTDKVLPLDRVFFWINSDGSQIHYKREKYGSLQRRGLSKVQSEKNLLVGILEGPPPIPRENMNIPDEYDPSERGTGKSVYSKVETGSFAYNLNIAAGFIGKFSGQGGFIGGAKAEFALGAGYKFAYESKTVDTKITSYEVMARKQKIGDEYTLQPLGAAVLLSTAWTGYAYEYVAPDGKVPKFTPVFYQVFPTENDLHLTSRPYAINPKYGPIPGDLNSYKVSEEKKKFFDSKALQLVSGKNHLSSSWSVSGKIVESFEQYVEKTLSHGLYVDFKALIGPSLDGWLFAKGEALVGVEFKMDMTFKEVKGEKIGLYSECQTRGNVEYKGTYVSYDFYTYQLAPDNLWEKEFLDHLVTEDWPENDTYREYNLGLKKSIVPGSKPWKIVHLLAGSKKN